MRRCGVDSYLLPLNTEISRSVAYFEEKENVTAFTLMIVISCCLFEMITNSTFNLIKRKNNSLTSRLDQSEINDVKKTKL